MVTLQSPLSHAHFGAAGAESYVHSGKSLKFDYDMRAEVGHLTRNVVIQGVEGERWGGQIVVVDFKDVNETMFQGTVTLKNVEMKRLSQYDTSRAAVRFEQTGTSTDAPTSLIHRCSISDSSAWAVAIKQAKGITFTDNVVYKTHRNAFKVEGVTDLVMTGNLFLSNAEREWDASLKLKDHQVAVDLCRGELTRTCNNIKVQNNTIAGGKGVGWLIHAEDCDNEATQSETFKHNVAHSLEVGVVVHYN